MNPRGVNPPYYEFVEPELEAGANVVGLRVHVRRRRRARRAQRGCICYFICLFLRSLPTEPRASLGASPLGGAELPPQGGGGLIPVANRRGAVDAKIDVGRNKELRLLTPASRGRRWVLRFNNPF